MKSTRLLLFVAASIFAGGCSISSTLNKIERENEKTVDIICECDPPTIGGLTCEEQYSADPFADADRDCVEDALALDKEGSKEGLECSLAVSKDYNECLKDMYVCDDLTSIQNCASIFEDYGDCPETSEEVQTELSKCYSDDDGQ